ncbi:MULTISPECIES: hypothetical protein [Methylosinus]|nr:MULTISPECIES: hypothetical protein [Methylosinus]
MIGAAVCAIYAALDRHQAEIRGLVAHLAEVTGEPSANGGAAQSSLIPLKDAAQVLGQPYDTVRQRATRGGELVRFGQRAFVRSAWLEAEVENVRSVRSLAEQPPARAKSRK